MKAKTPRSCLSKPVCRMIASYARQTAGAISAIAMVLCALTTAIAEKSKPAPAARICVIVPHFKDEYWLSVGFGLGQAAESAGAELLTYESGGYHSLARQIALMDTCRSAGADAILIGAVSASDPRLTGIVAETAKTIPVLALVNALNAPGLSGWIGVDWQGMGRAVGSFLALRHPNGTMRKHAVLVTGPLESGWAPILDRGLAQGLTGSAVEIVRTYRADTGFREQLREVELAIADFPDIDYLIGSAPAIEGAMALFRRMPEHAARPKLVATYISHSVLRGLKRGQVEMVPFDDPIAQGRLGVELALRAIDGEKFSGLSGPEIVTVGSDNQSVNAIKLSPSGFFPELD